MNTDQPPPRSAMSTNGPIFRRAGVRDLDQIFDVRVSVIENHLDREQLRTLGITEQSMAAAMESELGAWVAESGGRIVGFSMAQAGDGRVFALFVRPGFEGVGIGKALLGLAVEWLRDGGLSTAWLTTGEGSRAVRFYESQGWSTDYAVDGGEIRFELDLGIPTR